MTQPEAIQHYTQAIVDNNTKLFDVCFNDDAVVTDNSETMRGLEAIRVWGDNLSKIQLSTEITSVTVDGDKATITTFVAGDFKGSPLPFRYAIQLHDGKISSLDIAVAS